MKLKILVSALIIAVVGTIFLLKSNDNGGNVMAEAQTKSNKKVLVAYFSRTGE